MMYAFTRMWKHARKLLVLAAALALPGAAVSYGQGAPPVLPDKTVYGRLGTGTGSGPAQAIPFATLGAQIPSGGIAIGTTTVTGAGAGQFLFNNGGVVNAATLGTMSTQNATAVAITGGTITGLPSPAVTADAATKGYVDAVAIGLTIHTQVSWATTTVLPNTPNYSNGTAGVGATLTASGNAAIAVDGGNPVLNDRILVKNQAAGAQNGVYTVTTVGSGSVPWVLTRATDFNTATAGNMAEGAYFFVGEGTTNIASSWVFTTTGALTIGTTALAFSQFSNGSGGPWGVSGSNIYYNAGNVGIGTSSPVAALDIHGGISEPGPTSNFFVGTGGIVNYINDRLFVGGATVQNGQNTTQPGDFLTTGTCVVGGGYCPAGIGGYAQLYVLNNTNALSLNGIVAGVQNLNTAGNAVIAVTGISYSNAPAGTGDAYGYYGECHKDFAGTGHCIGMELDVRSEVAEVNPDPFTVPGTIGIQDACGAGSSAPFNCGTAIQIGANLSGFLAGIVFNNSSLSSGSGGSLNAIAMPPNYSITWFSSANTKAGQIAVDGSGNFIIGVGGTIIIDGSSGLTCNGINAGTFQSVRGIVTHC